MLIKTDCKDELPKKKIKNDLVWSNLILTDCGSCLFNYDNKKWTKFGFNEHKQLFPKFWYKEISKKDYNKQLLENHYEWLNSPKCVISSDSDFMINEFLIYNK